MNNTFNTEDIKHEITRWATVKTPALYDHFSTYLGIQSKEIRKLFTGSQEIQDHINQYFQEDRIQERIELQEQLARDLVVLAELIKDIVDQGKTITTVAIVKATGIARCNIKTFAHANPELWEQATAVKALEERRRLKGSRLRLKAERKAETEAQHAENRRLRAIRQVELDALLKARKEQKEANAAYGRVLAERKAQLEEIQAQKKAEREAIRLEKTRQGYETFGSYIGNELRYEKGRLVKKLEFFISNLDLVRIGFTGHINFIFGDDNCCGIYVQHEADHLGTFPTRINKDFHKFEITWNKRICDEPAEHTRAPLHLHLVETPHNNGFYFKIPERFFLGYIPD